MYAYAWSMYRHIERIAEDGAASRDRARRHPIMSFNVVAL